MGQLLTMGTNIVQAQRVESQYCKTIPKKNWTIFSVSGWASKLYSFSMSIVKQAF